MFVRSTTKSLAFAQHSHRHLDSTMAINLLAKDLLIRRCEARRHDCLHSSIYVVPRAVLLPHLPIVSMFQNSSKAREIATSLMIMACYRANIYLMRLGFISATSACERVRKSQLRGPTRRESNSIIHSRLGAFTLTLRAQFPHLTRPN